MAGVVQDRDGFEVLEGLAQVVLGDLPSPDDFGGGDVVPAFLEPLPDAADIDVVAAGAREHGFDDFALCPGPPNDGGS